MVILIEKRGLRLLVLFLLVFSGMAVILWTGSHAARSVAGSADLLVPQTIVIDPGHGGEDGGAVAGDGTVESGINLEIAEKLNDLLQLLGEHTLMTRTEDVSIYSNGAETLHEKKVSDLKNRVALVNSTPNAFLVSIHQNCLPASPRVQGAQTFFNTVSGAKELANAVQTTLNQTINTEKKKEIKSISPTIYLMKNVTAPAILVECGFLSNGEETQQLKDPTYQRKLAASIAAGVLSGEV